jgi:hypothetical protein
MLRVCVDVLVVEVGYDLFEKLVECCDGRELGVGD